MAGELRAFGSYAAGLYLPTGDMDLVFLTRKYRPNVIPDKSEVRIPLNMFDRFLRNRRIADPSSIVVIRHAKVPIIKFVDRISGLKVDLCFDNDSGFTAIDTFKKWKKEHPLMPNLVSIIKQFLMIRGMNDVATGGLGGFSTICLVTSFMQLYPRLNAMTGQAPNLGELLLEFFDFYGNVFERDSVAIRLDPPGYVDKVPLHYLYTSSKLTDHST
jgi:non-canonical poly(A) RNA polymerase PAPD5/7